MGITNPIPLMEKLYTLIEYDAERMRRKYDVLCHYIRRFDLNINPVEFIEHYPDFFAQSEDKILLVARIIAFCALQKSEVNRKRLASLLNCSPEDLILGSVNSSCKGLSFLSCQARVIKTNGMSREQKEVVIRNLPKTPIQARYFKMKAKKINRGRKAKKIILVS